ncbi:MAG: hypothetical protein OEY93_01900 [Anaerolineae bacterium]|nr:hypothetical protein [Anaerolineae bacterium]
MWSDFQIDFQAKVIEILNYPYPPSSVTQKSYLSPLEIDEIDPEKVMPEIRLKTGEILFFPAGLRSKLQKFARRHQIPLIKRVDVWSLILEPFLDRDFLEEQDLQTKETLKGLGLSPQEVDEIRAQVEDAMIAYNFESMLWERDHLGLPDLLDALMGRLSGSKYRLSPEEFQEFYSQAMEIAQQAKVF